MVRKCIKYWCIKNMSKVYLISCPILIVSKVYQSSVRVKKIPLAARHTLWSFSWIRQHLFLTIQTYLYYTSRKTCRIPSLSWMFETLPHYSFPLTVRQWAWFRCCLYRFCSHFPSHLSFSFLPGRIPRNIAEPPFALQITFGICLLFLCHCSKAEFIVRFWYQKEDHRFQHVMTIN